MSNVYMIGDLHFGHKRIHKFRSRDGFADEAEHSNFICENWKGVVGKNDVVYVMGDAAMTLEGLTRFHDLPGRKILVRGNHDEFNAMAYLAVFSDVRGGFAYKGAWLSHFPIHPGELRGRVNIHGHSHCDEWGKGYINVCAEYIGYTPKLFQTIMEEYKETYSAA